MHTMEINASVLPYNVSLYIYISLQTCHLMDTAPTLEDNEPVLQVLKKAVNLSCFILMFKRQLQSLESNLRLYSHLGCFI